MAAAINRSEAPASAPKMLFSEDFLSAANPYLLQGEIAAAVLLGIGIVYESAKYPETVHRLAYWYVILGVVFETVFSAALFFSEETVGSLQREQIIALETRLAPRRIFPDNAVSIVNNLGKYAGVSFSFIMESPTEESWQLREDIKDVLLKAGWKFDDVGAGIGGITRSGLNIYSGNPAAETLANELNKLTIATTAQVFPNSTEEGKKSVMIEIGWKP